MSKEPRPAASPRSLRRHKRGPDPIADKGDSATATEAPADSDDEKPDEKPSDETRADYTPAGEQHDDDGNKPDESSYDPDATDIEVEAEPEAKTDSD